jgi:DNA-directed RNA polymerase subunit beta'
VVKAVAADRDTVVIDARRSEAEVAAALAAPAPVAAPAGFAEPVDSRDE